MPDRKRKFAGGIALTVGVFIFGNVFGKMLGRIEIRI